MRFIFNFVFFGLLFFVIWKFFPDAFTTLVGWVSALYNYLHHLFQSLIDNVNKATETGEHPVKQTATMLPFLFTLWKK
ncbi:MAG: hypothetical protein WC222_00680 [Parachlamydiales bacterium]|jgi:hypothetical protein